MLEDASNLELLTAWRAGNEHAARVLVRRYMSRLTALARARLSRKLARRLDSEDIVMSAWRSFFVAAGRDQISVPDDDNLWPLLVTMTLRKLARQADRHTAAKRSLDAEIVGFEGMSWPDLVARDPSPEEAVMVTDEIESLMSVLSAIDREILTRRLQGEEQASIAAAVGCSERTVRRSLQRVRDEYLTRQQTDGTVSDLRDSQSAVRDSMSGRTSLRDAEHSVPDESSSLSGKSAFTFKDVLLEKLIGQGAFGRVYRSRLADGKTVAVKFLRKNLWRDMRAASQLVREVSILSKLSHPGIIRHLGWGRTDGGAVFSVMDFVDGTDLDAWFHTGRLSLADIITCGLGICDAVAAAHRSGVIHADLTPRNVLRTRDGRFVLTDFGFSRLAGDSLVALAAGTPGFLAPEQLCDAFGEVSCRTDVFGIGGVLYFLLTGQPPSANGTIPEVLAETLSSRPVRPAAEIIEGLPERLDDLLSQCLSKEPRDRPDSVESIRCELADICQAVRSEPVVE